MSNQAQVSFMLRESRLSVSIVTKGCSAGLLPAHVASATCRLGDASSRARQEGMYQMYEWTLEAVANATHDCVSYRVYCFHHCSEDREGLR